MSTNALELRDILRDASRKPEELRLSEAIASVLDLQGENGDIEATRVVALLARRIESDISNLADEESQSHAKESFRPYSALGNFVHFHQQLKPLKTNILKPETLKSLISVHAALNGVRGLKVNQQILTDKAEILSGLADEIADIEELPEHLRIYFYEQLKMVAAVLGSYSKFGAKYAEEQLFQLVSAIGLKGQPIKEKSPGVFKKLKAAAFDTMRGVQEADKTREALEGIAQSDAAKWAIEAVKDAM